MTQEDQHDDGAALKPRWPIVVQWDDGELQVIDRDEWDRDSDLSCWDNGYLLAFDSAGRRLTISPPTKPGRTATQPLCDANALDDDALAAALALDYRLSGGERCELTGLGAAEPEALIERLQTIPDRKPEQSRPYKLNVVGDFFVADGCCTMCGVPESEAPELFGEGPDGCYVKQQPSSAEELEHMLSAMAVQELGCIRYQGTDRTILARL